MNAVKEETISRTKGLSQCYQEYLPLENYYSDYDMVIVIKLLEILPFDEVVIGVYLSRKDYFWT